MNNISKLPYQLANKISPNTFSYLFIKKYPSFISHTNQNLLNSYTDSDTDIYYQEIVNKDKLKFLISTYQIKRL